MNLNFVYILLSSSFIFFLIKFILDSKFIQMKLFVFYLFCIMMVEFLAVVFVNEKMNNGFYNFFSLLEFNLLLLFYKKNSKNKLTKKTINVFLVLFNMVLILSNFYYGIDVFWVRYNSIAPVFGSILVSIVFMLYLREMLLSEEIIYYKKNIFFWITSGLLLYYLGTLPLTAMLSFLKKGSAFVALYKIQHLLTIVMHSCFLIGLLWSLKKVK